MVTGCWNRVVNRDRPSSIHWLVISSRDIFGGTIDVWVLGGIVTSRFSIVRGHGSIVGVWRSII